MRRNTMIRNTDVQKKHSGERIRNSACTVLVCAALFLAQSCTNVIHELIPPSDSGIHSFSVENTDRTRWRAAETDSTDITITVPDGTDITALVPVIELDSKSTVIPVTLPYIHRAFPSADLMSLAVQMNASQKAGDLGNWMLNFIRENKDFSVPPLDEPVDFTQPVMFCVIAGRGNYKLYTVTVVPEKPENPAEPDTPSPSEPDTPDEPGTPDEPSVPPQTECEKKILSFVVNEPKQTKPSVITEDTVTFYLNAGADSSALYPVITVSEGAGILPLTQEYLLRLFSYTEMISLYSGYSTATDINAFISNTVKKLDADKIAKIMEADLSLPIDFSGLLNFFIGIPFAVVGADKTVHVYYISRVTAEDTAALTAFAVTKIRNPGLMGDADVSFSGDAVTITATYPVEYQNFKLIPDIVIDGDTWEITGGTLRTEDVGASGEETECTAGLKKAVYLVPGDAYPVGNEYTATLTVRRGEAAASYTLRLIYKEDEDTIRSITDFRFLRLRNPGIKTTSMASISKNEDTGFISAAVMYEGDEPPYDLVADFYSPGTCTVEHAVQVSGKSRNNFRYDVQILCTSKNKLFCRLYTVHVTFIKVKTAEAVLNYFAFPKHLNPELSQSATGLIDESSGTVYVNAKYHTPEKPAHLVPEFAATGTVSVNSILQSSGYSAQDFSRSVYYSVRDQNDWSSDSRTYRISVNWEQDEQSACAITGFGFSTADNPSLEKDVSARINERVGTIYALLPKDAGKSSLAPYFSAKGTVTVNGAEQTSGSSRQDFSDEVVYTVTSANGLYTKQYSVSVQEAGPVIYVNAAAIGRNNGTCWQDAYITLDAAFEQAQAYGDAHKEIWIAYNGGEAYAPLSDAYRTNGLPLTANTTVRGGFDGTETDADERRTKKRRIEFDVNTVEDATDGKMKTIPVRHEADVCEVQTKLLFPTASSSCLFTLPEALPEGEITLDGIEVDYVGYSHSYNIDTLISIGRKKSNVSVTITSCTIRVPSIASVNNAISELNITDSDFDLCEYMNADNITAKRSKFEIDMTPYYAKWYGYTADFTHCEFLPSRQMENYINKYSCIQFGMSFYNNASITECRFLWNDFPKIGTYRYDHRRSNIKYKNCLLEFIPNNCIASIENCEVGTENDDFYPGILLNDKINTIKNSDITAKGSIFHNVQLDCTSATITNCSFTNTMDSLNSLIVYENNFDTAEIEDTTLNGYPLLLATLSGTHSYSYKNIRMNRCTVTCDRGTSYGYNQSSEDYYGTPLYSFISTINSGAVLEIHDCTFDIQTKPVTHHAGETGMVSITGSQFRSSRACFYTDSPTTFTGNTITATGIIPTDVPAFSNSNLKYACSAVIFRGENNEISSNAFSGRITQIKTSGILQKNEYDGFVIYDLTGINVPSEQIDIKQQPLYTSDGALCTKKAFLTVKNGSVTSFDKNLFCGLRCINTDCELEGINLSAKNIPFSFTSPPDPNDLNSIIHNNLWYQSSYPTSASTAFSGSGEMLTLTNCNITGPTAMSIAYNSAELTKCTVTATDTTDATAITSSAIGNSTLIISSGSTVSGQVLGGTATTIKNSTVTGTVSSRDITVSENSKTGSISSSNGTVEVSGGSTTGDISSAETISVKNSSTVGRITTSVENASVSCSGSTVESIYSNYGTVTLKNCTFNGNGQKQTYPAVRIGEQGYTYGDTAEALIVDNCTFSNYILNNSEDSYVGGAAISAKAKTVEIKNNCRFSNCTNKNDNSSGGAINIKADTVGIDSALFTGNTATYWRGGAVYISAKTVSINDCTFTGNKTLETYNRHAGGGAVAITCSQDNVIADISNCTFSGNSNAVENYGTDVWMSAEFVKGDTEEIESSYSGCTLTINSCTTDKTSGSLYKNNVELPKGIGGLNR